MLTKIKHNKLPITVNFTASCPIPSNNILWAGSTANAVSSAGAPRYVALMKSVKVWVIDIAIMKDATAITFVYPSKKGEMLNKINATRFM